MGAPESTYNPLVAAFRSVDYREARSLGGGTYTAMVSAAAGGDSSYLYLQVLTPKTSEGKTFILDSVFANMEGGANTCGALKLIEDPALTTGTTAVSMVNTNRVTATAAKTKIYSDPTSISSGSTLYSDLAFVGTNGHGEWKLDRATLTTDSDGVNYILSLQNKSGAAAAMTLGCTFSEVT